MQTLDLSAIDIASFVTKFCALNNYFINITKLQKLVYCCYGVVLAAQDTRLCKEHPKTWTNGPVFTKIYKAQALHQGVIEFLLDYNSKSIPSETKDLVVETLDVFVKYNAGQLVRWSKQSDGPWKSDVTANGYFRKMDDMKIKNYFEKTPLKKLNAI